MRKLFIMTLSLVAGIACMTSCNKESQPENTVKYDYNFTFSKDTETKAVKSAWADGDKIQVYFQGWLDGYLEFTYNEAAGTWAQAEKAIAGGTPATPTLTDGGNCLAIWCDGNSLDASDASSVTSTKATVNYPLKEMLVSVGGTVNYNGGGTVGAVTYSLNGTTVSAQFTMKQHPCYTKVTATGLDASKTWYFNIKKGALKTYKPQLEITNNSLTLKTKDMGIANGYCPVIKNEGEELYFFYNSSSLTGKTVPNKQLFILMTSDQFHFGKWYTVTLANHVGEAIKLNASKLSETSPNNRSESGWYNYGKLEIKTAAMVDQGELDPDEDWD